MNKEDSAFEEIAATVEGEHVSPERRVYLVNRAAAALNDLVRDIKNTEELQIITGIMHHAVLD